MAIRNTDELQAAVIRGAKHLDSQEPLWFKRIDIETLDLSYGYRFRPTERACILCQLVTPQPGGSQSYSNGVDEYNLPIGQNEQAAYGFDCSLDEREGSEAESDLVYFQLTELWTEQINIRLRLEAEDV